MKSLKQIADYLIWTVVALLVGIGYMRILLGPLPSNDSYWGFGFLLKVFLIERGIQYGLVIGGIIALLFILLDIFYLKRKLEKGLKSVAIRFASLIAITVVIAIIHYVLEKVIDVI